MFSMRAAITTRARARERTRAPAARARTRGACTRRLPLRATGRRGPSSRRPNRARRPSRPCRACHPRRPCHPRRAGRPMPPLASGVDPRQTRGSACQPPPPPASPGDASTELSPTGLRRSGHRALWLPSSMLALQARRALCLGWNCKGGVWQGGEDSNRRLKRRVATQHQDLPMRITVGTCPIRIPPLLSPPLVPPECNPRTVFVVCLRCA